MRKSISILLAVLLASTACFTVLWFVFPERLFISHGVDGIESVKVVWKPYGAGVTVSLTDREDIRLFCDVMKETRSLRCNLFVDHNEGVYSDPAYRLYITYTDGNTVTITTTETGMRILRFWNPASDSGESSYISAENEALYEWVKSIAFSIDM